MVKKKLVMLSSVLSLAALLTGCGQADVIGKTAITSFDKFLGAMEQQVSFEEAKNSWVIETPTGEYFEYSKDFSTTVSDAAVEFDAAPFIAAGLDTTKLPEIDYIYDPSTGRIRMTHALGEDEFKYTGEATPIDTFKKIVETNRDIIGYHQELDHYGIALGNGNMFEWAKNMSKNDKDMVLVLNPQPFIDAGVDPAAIEGWVFGKVKVNDGGKMVEVDKLLKPFDIQ
jgi:major membrane immunogen (membrane-anchored lipoprotein)